MSIATLKKKTNQKYNSMSTGRTGFSINGTLRNQGFVGQNIISRSFPSTKFRGNVARGHGGNNGQYHTPRPIVSSIQSQNDPTYVKSSVLGTTGMIMTKYRWIRRPNAFATVKSTSTNNNNNQSDYINQKRLNATTDAISNTNDNLSILPIPFTSSVCGVCNLSGTGAQNGIYKVAQSSGIGYKAFNASSTGWISGLNYDLTGAYTGSSAISGISGEWLQLQIPSTLGQLFTLTKYSISPIVSEFDNSGNYDLNFDSSPKEWYVLGSNNGNTWVAVDHQNIGSYWSDKHLLGKTILPLTFSVNNSSVGYNYYTIIFVSNGAGTYQDTNEFSEGTYIGIQDFTFSGVIQKGLNQNCSAVKINVDSKVNKKSQYNVTKIPFPTINQSDYISKKQRVCVYNNDVSDLQNNTCTSGF
jgi:hypothetical protein